MVDQLWNDERVDEALGKSVVSEEIPFTAKTIREMRDDYEMQLDEYRERAERSPGIISALELENWKLNQRIAALEAKTAELYQLANKHDWELDPEQQVERALGMLGA